MNCMKKIMTLVYTMAILITMMSVGAYASDNEITLNQNPMEINEMMYVENGEAYFPIRLSFPRTNPEGDISKLPAEIKNNLPQVPVAYEPCVIVAYDDDEFQKTIELTYGKSPIYYINEAGRCYGKYENGYPVMSGERRRVTIFVDENGNAEILHGVRGENESTYRAIGGFMNLKNSIVFKPLSSGTGDRAYVSQEDLSAIITYLVENDSYNVELN